MLISVSSYIMFKYVSLGKMKWFALKPGDLSSTPEPPLQAEENILHKVVWHLYVLTCGQILFFPSPVSNKQHKIRIFKY